MRCNAGVNPAILTDQHLIAEYRELLIPVGQLIHLNWESKTPIPPTLKLGKGHVSFWRDKQLYLKRRHEAIVKEMLIRGFKPNYTFWNIKDIPPQFLNDWNPTFEDSTIIRKRIVEKIMMKPGWYKICRECIKDPQEYINSILKSPVVF